MPEWLSNLLIAVIGASLGGGGVTLWLAPKQRRKLDSETTSTDATAAKTITDSAMQLLGPLRTLAAETQAALEAARAELNQTRDDLEHTKTELAATRAEAAALTRELTCLREEYELYRAMHPPRT